MVCSGGQAMLMIGHVLLPEASEAKALACSACSREQGAGCMGAPAAISGRRKDSGATSHVRKASPSYGSFARPPWPQGPGQRSGGSEPAARGPHAWNAMVEAATAAASHWGIVRLVPSLAAEQGSARPMGRTSSLCAGGAGEGEVQAARRNECGVKVSTQPATLW